MPNILINNLSLIGEILGFIAIGLGLSLFQVSRRRVMLVIKLICDLLWIVHFALIGAYSGMAISCVGLIRELTFIIGGKRAQRWPVFASLMVLATAGVALFWDGYRSIFSLFSTLTSTTAYAQSNVKRTKLLLFAVAISQLAYAILSRSYAAMINELLAIGSFAVYCVREKRVES